MTKLTEQSDSEWIARMRECIGGKDVRETHPLQVAIFFNEAIKRLEQRNAEVARLKELVAEQAEDEGLWFNAQTASEAYLQQELRRIHAAIEGDHIADASKKVGGDTGAKE